MQNSRIRDINPTTKRLVERCLSGEWCVQLKNNKKDSGKQLDYSRGGSPSCDSIGSQSHLGIPGVSASTELNRSGSGKTKTLKSSKSVEYIKGPSVPQQQRQPRPSNASVLSLSGVASATPPGPPSPLAHPKRKGSASSAHVDGTFSDRHSLPHSHLAHNHHPQSFASSVPASPTSSDQNGVASAQAQVPHRRSAPPAPPKRRKPPAIPVGHTNGGATITAIRTSVNSPLAKVSKPPGLQHSTLL